MTVSPAAAQEWADFTSKIDRFTVNLPGQPKVEEIKWQSEYDAVFPGRVYSLEQGGNRYSVTVIDYTDSEAIHAARPNRTEAEAGGAYWQVDIVASIAYAATKFRQRPGVKVTYDAYHYIDLVSGHQLQLTNQDQSTNLPWHLPARESPLHPRSDRATESAPARAVSTVVESAGRRGQPRSLPDHLLQPAPANTVGPGWTRRSRTVGPSYKRPCAFDHSCPPSLRSF